MFLKDRFMIVVGVFACAGLTLWANPVLADLDDYIRKPEPAFAWRQNGKTSRDPAGDLIYDLHFVSQTWQGKKLAASVASLPAAVGRTRADDSYG